MCVKAVSSNQIDIHADLASVVTRHRDSVFRRPIAEHSRHAFDRAQTFVDRHGGPVVLDTGCGVGESTRRLADTYPGCAVIGVDKSGHRLDRHSASQEHYLLLRADLVDFWRLAEQAGWRLQRHTFFYPNPWPKAEHLKRRWHGHPVLPSLLALGGEIELRTNWDIYAREFAEALALMGWIHQLEQWTPDPAWTPFERKYQQAGQSLWRLTAQPMGGKGR